MVVIEQSLFSFVAHGYSLLLVRCRVSVRVSVKLAVVVLKQQLMFLTGVDRCSHIKDVDRCSHIIL